MAADIHGGNGNDLLRGTSSSEKMYGNAGNDSLYGYGGNDQLHGQNGHDYLNGGDGNDSMYGGDNNSGWDTLIGGNGSDKLHGQNGNDSLRGDGGNDTLYGDNNDDKLFGGLGNDDLRGGDGNDILDGFLYSGLSGNGEIDYLRGDAGADIFVIGGSYGQGYLGKSWAVIQDFNWREDHHITVKGSLGQYSLKPGNSYGYNSSDMAIVSSSNTSEVYAIVINGNTIDSSGNKNLLLTTRDFISA